jgi:hypothetical protein
MLGVAQAKELAGLTPAPALSTEHNSQSHHVKESSITTNKLVSIYQLKWPMIMQTTGLPKSLHEIVELGTVYLYIALL